MAKEQQDYLWRATYTHSRALPGMNYDFYVHAPDEETAKMRAGMARAESLVTYWTDKMFPWPKKVKWIRLSLEKVEDVERN